MSNVKDTTRHTPLDAARELNERSVSALELFRPLPHQEEFLLSDFTEALVGGGSRGGKSTILAVWFASYATGIPITLRDGRKVCPRRKNQKNRKLRLWVVCYTWAYAGTTIYRLLFEPGLFKIIMDRNTMKWVAFDPENPEHAGREDECRPSPPLLNNKIMAPKDEWSWENRKDRQFHRADARDGSFEIHIFPSSQKEPKAGDPVDAIWVDENLESPKHYAEYTSRLIDYNGRLAWASWAKVGSPALIALKRKAEAQQKNPPPQGITCRYFVLQSNRNIHLPKEGLQNVNEGRTVAEIRQRDYGEFLDDDYRMYSGFDEELHNAIPTNPELDDMVAKVLRKNNCAVPKNWRRDLILDPGTAHPGILLIATPPPDIGNCYVVYDEIYPGKATAEDLCKIITSRHRGDVYQSFIIDGHAGRQTPLGFGHTVEDNYARAFAEHGLYCQDSGNRFSPGSDNVEARCQILIDHLLIQSDGKPRFRVIKNNCPNLIKQFQECMRALDKEGNALDRPATGQKIDLLDCATYFVSRRVCYKAPPTSKSTSPMLDEHQQLMQMFDRLAERNQERHGHSSVGMSFGPPAAA